METKPEETMEIFPPRPNAIITMITTDNFLPGAQTMLYSAQKAMRDNKNNYPPELIVMVTPNISQQTRDALCPVYCTRILEVEPLSFPKNQDESTNCHVPGWTSNGALTKLHIFRLNVYNIILYIDADCLVVKDVSHLLQDFSHKKEKGLLSAAPDIFPPDKFNAGVLLIRPCPNIFQDMLMKTNLHSYDGGDTGFLNAYYSDWHAATSHGRRLGFGYNAQRFMHHCTYEKQPNYWNKAIDLFIIHYSSSPKPWEVEYNKEEEQTTANNGLLSTEDSTNLKEAMNKNKELESSWWKWYKESQAFLEIYQNNVATAQAAQTKQIKDAKRRQPKTSKEIHKLVTKRYQELRKKHGKSSSDAMMIARREYRLDKDDNDKAKNPGSQVAAMFGMG